MIPGTKASALNPALVRWLNDRANEGIFTTDRDLIIRSWNAWLTRTTGLTAGSVVGRALFEVCPELPERGLDRYYRNALDGQASMLAHRFHSHLLRIATVAGDMPQSCQVAPLIENAAVIGTVTVIQDVSERVQSEAELRRQIAAAEAARGAAEAALRAKDEFLATLSHELRTPLNAVLGWTNILMSGSADTAMLERALQVIERNALVQARLIDDMLDMARIVTGKIRLEFSVVDVAAAVSSAIDVVRPTAAAKRIALQTSVGAGPKLIQADPARLQQVVWNVLSNAIKFTPPGGQISLEVTEADATVSITIRDNGKGIAPDFLPHVFDRFRQANSSLSRSEGGLGLGLALVRQLVDLHGGDVKVSSDGPNRGSTFTIMFPSLPAETETADRDRKRRMGAESLAGQRILLVDDDTDWCEALSTALQALGADVDCDGAAAETMARLTPPTEQPWTALVIDVGLPGEDGFALVKQVRALEGDVAKTPAIAVTAYVADEYQRRALTTGFDAFRAKPISPEDVAAAIIAVMRSRG